MKIRNTRGYDLYLPYAGQRRGMLVKAGGYSMDLPTERFYDPLLQRDWRAGKIEVFLSNMDKAVLGPAASSLPSETVEVADEPLPAPAPAAAPTTVKLDPGTGAQTPVVLPPAAPPPKKTIGKKTDPKDAPAATISQQSGVIRLHKFAEQLGVRPKSVLAKMKELGMETKTAMQNITLGEADALRPYFSRQLDGAPALDPSSTVDRAGQKIARLHEVPGGAGAPATSSAPGSPSLDDLRRMNARLNLGTPKFGSGSVTGKVKIEMPGASQFGSTLQSGTPQAQRAAAEADAAAAKAGANQ